MTIMERAKPTQIYILNELLKEIKKYQYKYMEKYRLPTITMDSTLDDVNDNLVVMIEAEAGGGFIKSPDDRRIFEQYDQMIDDVSFIVDANAVEHGRRRLLIESLVSIASIDNILALSNRTRMSLTDGVKDIISALKSKTSELYVVGGSVRDACLGLKSKDFDLVTDLSYDDIVSTLLENGYSINETGKEFLVIKATKDGVEYDVASFRTETSHSDGRRPSEVDTGDIYQDAQRRDFSINALYYCTTNGLICDPTGFGINDILSETLRFVGDPKERIRQDYLRSFRFFRFMKTKSLTPVPSHLRAVRDMWEEAYTKTNPQRAICEIEKM